MKENGVRMKEIGLLMARERRRMMGDLSCGKWGADEEKGASDGEEAAADNRGIVMREMEY